MPAGAKKGERRGGRKKGTRNKLTMSAREAIEAAAQKLGGCERLAEWATEDPKNELAFWATIYPKLMPLQVTGKDGEALIVKVIRFSDAGNHDTEQLAPPHIPAPALAVS